MRIETNFCGSIRAGNFMKKETFVSSQQGLPSSQSFRYLARLVGEFLSEVNIFHVMPYISKGDGMASQPLPLLAHMYYVYMYRAERLLAYVMLCHLVW
jgi:hypothetical protein